MIGLMLLMEDESLSLQDLRTLPRLLNFAVMILAGPVSFVGRFQPCWTADVKCSCSIQKFSNMKILAFNIFVLIVTTLGT